MKKIKFRIILPRDIKLINQAFKKHGYSLYLVGGAVRDAILGKQPKDFDLTTDAKPDTIINILKSEPFVKNILETGKAFGVINVVTSNDEYEIATFREDLSGGRRPDAVRFADIETDALRRDLTFNALYYDIENEEIIDLVGGYDDLKNKIVKTVGSAKDRFGEDRLRIMRALRFAARFNTKLSDDIRESLMNDNSLEGVSYERIRDEFLKGIKTAKSVKYFLNLISEFNLWRHIFPGLVINKKFIETKLYKPLISIILFPNDYNFVNKQLNKLAYTKEEGFDIAFLIRLKDFDINRVVEFKKLLNRTNLSKDEYMLFVNNSDLDKNILEKLYDFQLTVKAGDLILKGIKPGPELGKVIEKIEINNFLKML